MCSFIVVHERSITKCDLINNSIKIILLRSIGLFLFFYEFMALFRCPFCHSINTGPYGENTEIYSSLTLLHWLNLNCASIIVRSFTNFVFFYVDRNSKMTIVPMSVLFFSHNFVILQFSKKVFCKCVSLKTDLFLRFVCIFFSDAIALIEPKLCINHCKVLYKLCVFLCWS
jgi:hypothetical protein